MTKNLPTTTAAEVVDISPEALEIANCYLQEQDISKVAFTLGTTPEKISQVLGRREVKAYVDQVFYNLGFNNRFKLRAAMDALIAKKFQEMDEADIGSNKDITELLALSHKMTMENLDREIKLEQLRLGNVKTQNNIQINDNAGGSRYSELISKLIGTQGEVVDAL